MSSLTQDKRRVRAVVRDEELIIAPTRVSLRDESFEKDLAFLNQPRLETRQEQTRPAGNQRLQEVGVNLQRFEEEMGTLSVDLQEAFLEFGVAIGDAYNYQGSERVWNFFGKFNQGARNKANQLRIHRLKTQTLDRKLEELTRLNNYVNQELNRLEGRNEDDRQAFITTRTDTTRKLVEAQPKLRQAIKDREELESQVRQLKTDLETGVIQEEERPGREKDLLQLQVNFHQAQMDETHFLSVVQTAQESIRTLEQAIDSTQKSIVAFHQMRIHQSEKYAGIKDLFERAMTDVIARATLEQYQLVDPAMNRATTELLRQKVLVSGAAMGTAIDRVEKSTIDPAIKIELADRFKAYIEEYSAAIQRIEDSVAEGVRPVFDDPDRSHS